MSAATAVDRAFWRVGMLGIAVFCLLAAASARNAHWKSDLSIWTDSVSKSPGNARALNNLGGLIYAHTTNYDYALYLCLRSDRILPEVFDVHMNLWQIYKEKGMSAEARIEVELGAKLLNKSPDAYTALGYYLQEKGWHEQAVRIFREAVATNPRSAENYYGWAVSLEQTGGSGPALERYREFIRMSDRRNPRVREAKERIAVLERAAR